MRIERLKNRLDPRHKSEETAGYRDVCLNLRGVNREAKSLGVDVHVCEVGSARRSAPDATDPSCPLPAVPRARGSPRAALFGALAVTCARTPPQQLQLILLDFAKLRTAEGHARYVQARNHTGK